MSRRSEEYELLTRTSADSFSHSDRGDYRPHSIPWYLRLPTWLRIRLLLRPIRILCNKTSSLRKPCWSLIRVIFGAILISLCIMILIIAFTAALWPSYTHLPDHYTMLQGQCQGSKRLGRGNANNQKIFIAATLHDPEGTLVDGYWGNAVLELVNLLGPDNVYLSIYENDADALAKASLEKLRKSLSSGNSSIISEHLPLNEVPHVTIPSGERRISRIAFLAHVRNLVLRPLEADSLLPFDKLLFLNDVVFNPVDAVQLLFSTNVDSLGHAHYGAACAVDFFNPFQFYDTFATRDFEGYDMGIPFFPWFANAGEASSRQDVLGQKDAVRVRSCWGGMTAFEAKWFQDISPMSTLRGIVDKGNNRLFNLSPLRFRYHEELFWEASECCLIHADLTFLRHGRNATTNSGIFMNPYVRVAYDVSTFRWLRYTRRIERLYSPLQNIINHMIGMPLFNPRRLEQPGDTAEEQVWKYQETGKSFQPNEMDSSPIGSYITMNRTVGPGRFCGVRKLFILKENPKKGEKNWMKFPPPPLPS